MALTGTAYASRLNGMTFLSKNPSSAPIRHSFERPNIPFQSTIKAFLVDLPSWGFCSSICAKHLYESESFPTLVASNR